jgi:tetratricopeptide (TPR) repeat protein
MTVDYLSIFKSDKINAMLAGFVFLFAFIVYFLTKAPTFSFWDCGEFVASAYILGIPHPPGSPLYVILGRFFSMLPIAADVAVRINLLSVVSSAASAMFGYLIVVRILQYWFADREDSISRMIIYIGGVTGSLFMAFSNTCWSNSVEAEVYSGAMLLMLIIIWLALKYSDNKAAPLGPGLILLIIFLGFLGIGIHLTMFVVIPVMGMYFILKKEAGTKEWGVVFLFYLLELYYIFGLSTRPNEIPLYLPILITFIVYIFHIMLIPKASRLQLITTIIFLVAIFPFFPMLLGGLMRNLFGANIEGVSKSLGQLPVTLIGLLALIGWGLFLIFKFLAGRSRDVSEPGFICGIYSIIPAALIVIERLLNGYTAFLVLTAVTLIALGLIIRKNIDWLTLIAVASVSLIIIGFWKMIFGAIIGIAIIIVYGLIKKDKSWQVPLAIIVIAILAFSVHAYIPVRSSQNPAIDENKTSQSLAATVGFLERRQYINESMVERMFERRGSWENQFGDYQRMGFWRFFQEQYGFNDSRFIIALVLGLFGIWETIRRRPTIGLPLLILIIICSVGLVLYMNFADGTRQNPVTGEDYLEVRNRDYFFTPAFMLFGLAIGIGIAAIIDFVRDSVKDLGSKVRAFSIGLACLLVFLPMVPLKVNYFINDRSRNYMPYDYGYNIINSCEKDAILFTYGDNDTFPLWCLQEVYGIRRDVRVVNLSLANAKWYIKQLRDYLNVPLNIDDDAIDRIRPYLLKDTIVQTVPNQAIDKIIEANHWQYPIYFMGTVPDNFRRYQGSSVINNTVFEGLLYRLYPERQKNSNDLLKIRKNCLETYSYRGLADPTVYKDENSSRLYVNYSQGPMVLAYSVSLTGDNKAALAIIDTMTAKLPYATDLYAIGTQILAEMGRIDTMVAYIEKSGIEDRYKLYFNWGMAAQKAGRRDDAITALEYTHANWPEYAEGYRALASLYYQGKNYGKLRVLVSDWIKRHPDDMQSSQFLREVERRDSPTDTLGGNKR